MNGNTINARIKEVRRIFCDGKNIIFAGKMQRNPNTVSNWVRDGYNVGKGVAKEIADIFQVNLGWLLTGEGEMLKEGPPSEGVFASSDQYPMVESYPIPVYNLDAVAGMNTPNAVVDMPAYIDRWIQFPGARKGDIAFPVSNDSMIPRYLPGSLLQVRKVELWQEYFCYGNNFVLFFTDGRRILKEIQRSEEDPKTQVLCVSCNTKYPPEELPKSLIREVYKVIKSLSDEGF